MRFKLRTRFCWTAVVLGFTFLFTAEPLFAGNLPDWLVEAAERQIEGTDYELVWLHNELIVEPLLSGGVRITERRAGKAVLLEGLEEVSHFGVPYVDGDKVEQLRAWTLSPTGKTRKASREDVNDLPAALGDASFNDARVRTIRAPGMTVGSIAAFESIVVEQLDTGASRYVFGDADHRTLWSRLELRVPQGWSTALDGIRHEGLEIRESAGILVAEGKNLPRLPRLEYAPAPASRLPSVWVRWWNPGHTRGYTDWNSVGRWYEALTASTLEELGEAAEISRRLKPVDSADLERAIAESFEFASRQVRYVSIDIGIGLGVGYKPSTPASVCDKRYGDCKDKSFLMRAIAGLWGLNHYPVLVRTRDRGALAPDTPTPGQFNHCIAAIALPEGIGESFWATAEVEGLGRLLFLDATQSSGTAWDLRTDVQGTRALVVHADGAVLVDLPVQPPAASRIERQLHARLDEKGGLVEAQLDESWNGSAAVDARGSYSELTESAMRDRVVRGIQFRFPGAAVTDYEIEGLDQVDFPLVRRTKLSGGRFGKRVGDLLIVEPGQLGYGLMGSTLSAVPRTEPLYVGMPREERIRATVDLPEGWEPEAMPEDQSFRSTDLEFDSSWTTHEGRLIYERVVRLLNFEISPDRYADFQASVGRIDRADGEAVVFVKSTSPAAPPPQPR